MATPANSSHDQGHYLAIFVFGLASFVALAFDCSPDAVGGTSDLGELTRAGALADPEGAGAVIACGVAVVACAGVLA